MKANRKLERVVPQRAAMPLPRVLRDTIDKNGRYDAARLAKLLGWSFVDLARYLDRDPSTISRSGAAEAHQDKLARLVALVQEVLFLMMDDLPATIAWLRTPIPILDWTSPRDLIFKGDFDRVKSVVDEYHSGLAL
jgi:hypothetical protein